MGKSHYIGGGTEIAVYNEVQNLKKRIYKIIKSNVASEFISLETIEKYFENYDKDELLEVLEDMETNYKNRRSLLITKLRNSKRT